MMQSPSLSDSGRPDSPTNSSNPGSPLNNNNNSNTPNQEMKYPHSPNGKIIRYDSNDESSKDIKPKFSVLSAINKENSTSSSANRNNLDQILYPKPSDRDAIEPSAKFSIERLKQLADQRLSPSNIENSSLSNNKIYSIDHSAKYQSNSNSVTTTAITTMSLNAELLQSQINHHSAFTNHHPHHLNILNHSNHLNNLKYGLMPTVGGNVGIAMQNANNNNTELDIERIKLARTLSNGKELSDFGFRIQLGGLSTSYTHSSDTHSDSEELNVDGNEDSSQDGNSVSCVINSRLIYCRISPFYHFNLPLTTNLTPKNCANMILIAETLFKMSQTCPVDLTRSMDSKPSIESSEKETPKRLAFSVENILDPNKFTGKKHYGQGVNGSRMWNNIERDEKMDDDQSDDHSSEYQRLSD
jgi:hypothetical protein